MVVRLHAPERRNALSMEMVDSLHELLQQHPDHPLLIGSSTPGIFSAGADLGIDSQTRARLSDRLYACYELMLRRPGIIIAVVDGPAVGGGAQRRRPRTCGSRRRELAGGGSARGTGSLSEPGSFPSSSAAPWPWSSP